MTYTVCMVKLFFHNLPHTVQGVFLLTWHSYLWYHMWVCVCCRNGSQGRVWFLQSDHRFPPGPSHKLTRWVWNPLGMWPPRQRIWYNEIYVIWDESEMRLCLIEISLGHNVFCYNIQNTYRAVLTVHTQTGTNQQIVHCQLNNTPV